MTWVFGIITVAVIAAALFSGSKRNTKVRSYAVSDGVCHHCKGDGWAIRGRVRCSDCGGTGLR